MRVLRPPDGVGVQTESGGSKQTVDETGSRLLGAHAATPLRRNRLEAPVRSRQASRNRRGGVRVVSIAARPLDGLSVRCADGEGFPRGPERIDDIGAAR